MGITRLLAEAFIKTHPQISIDIPGSIGSKGAIKAAAEGAIALGLISRPLNEEEKKLGLTEAPYARVGIVVGAHPSVTEEGVTSEELVEIYKGTKNRWKDGNEIVVLSREKWDSGFMMLEEKIPGFKEVCEESRQAKRWVVNFTDQDANNALSTTPYAIGVADAGMIATERLNIKILKLNGLIPTPEDILSGQYPFVRSLSFVYRKESIPESAKAFLDFVRSDEGAKILRANRYVPEDQE